MQCSRLWFMLQGMQNLVDECTLPTHATGN